MPLFNQSSRLWSSLTTATVASSSTTRLPPLSLLLSRNDHQPSPFFQPNSDFRQDQRDGPKVDRSRGTGKGKRPVRQGDEELVDDQEWSLRVGQSLDQSSLRTSPACSQNPVHSSLSGYRVGNPSSAYDSASSVRRGPAERDVPAERV